MLRGGSVNIDSAWAVVAGVLIATTAPLVTGVLDRKARRAERIEIEQRETLRVLPKEMYGYLTAAGFAAGMGTDKPGPDFPPENANALVREKSERVVSLLNLVRDKKTRDAVERF